MIPARNNAVVPRLPIYQRPTDGGALPTPPGSPAKTHATPAPQALPSPPPSPPASRPSTPAPTRTSQGADIDGSSFQHSLPPDLGGASDRFAGRTQAFSPSDFQSAVPVGHSGGHHTEGPLEMGATLFKSSVPRDHIPHLPGRAPAANPGRPLESAGFGPGMSLGMTHSFGGPSAQSAAPLPRRESLGNASLAESLPPAAFTPPRPAPQPPPPLQLHPSLSAPSPSAPPSLHKEHSYGQMSLADSLPPAALEAKPQATGFLSGLKRLFGFG